MENFVDSNVDLCPASDKDLKAFINELILAIESNDKRQVEELLQREVPPKWRELAESIAGPYLDGITLNDTFYRLCLDINKRLAQE